jgi:hypothetical protein
MCIIFSVAAAIASIRGMLGEIWPTGRELEPGWVAAEPATEANGGIR